MFQEGNIDAYSKYSPLNGRENRSEYRSGAQAVLMQQTTLIELIKKGDQEVALCMTKMKRLFLPLNRLLWK